MATVVGCGGADFGGGDCDGRDVVVEVVRIA